MRSIHRIRHYGTATFAGSRQLYIAIQEGRIQFGGNRKLKIYCTLDCRSGKRMKPENRVFFSSEQEAVHAGYRPCAHCMAPQYQIWKQQEKKP